MTLTLAYLLVELILLSVTTNAQPAILTRNGTIVLSSPDVIVSTGTRDTSLVQTFVAVEALSSNIQSISSAQATSNTILSTSIGTESSRAIQTEQSLAGVAAAETFRANSVEQSLSRAAASNSALISALNSTTTASTSILSSQITLLALSNAATANTCNAQIAALSVNLSSRLAGDETLLASLSSLLNNAQNSAAATQSNLITTQATLASTAGAATNEAARALGVEASLSSKLLSLSASSVLEVSRATTAESQLALALAAETSRALATEASLSVKSQVSLNASIAAELSRASSIEQQLSMAILAQNISSNSMLGLLGSLSGTITNLNSSFNALVSQTQSMAIASLNTNAAVSLQSLQIANLTARLTNMTICSAQGLFTDARGNCMSSPSTWNKILNFNSNNARQYCSGASGGWMIAAEQAIAGQPLCKRVVADGGGCGSIFVNPGMAYNEVQAYVTLYQYYSTDAFGPGGWGFGGDALSLWSGSQFLWSYGVGYSNTNSNNGNQQYNCPGPAGGYYPYSLASGQDTAFIGKQYDCASGCAIDSQIAPQLYTTPLFGAGQMFDVYIPLTSAPIELRICVNQEHANEDIYIGEAVVSVRNTLCSTPNPSCWLNILNFNSNNAGQYCSGASGGWMIAAEQAIAGQPLCKRVIANGGGCGSIFVNPGTSYTTVNGQVTLYQYYSTDAFGPGAWAFGGDAVTFWSGSRFLWAYGVGYTMSNPNDGTQVYNCPAAGGYTPTQGASGQDTAYIGTSYYCQSGCPTVAQMGPQPQLYPDPLFGSAYQFTVTVPATSAPIELRICVNQEHANEVPLYVGFDVCVRVVNGSFMTSC